MAQYHIYHSTGINIFQEVEKQPRDYVGFIEADSLEDAFKLSQGDINPDWDSRSTSVGDVIQSDEGFYMVLGIGFQLLDEMSKNESELNALENQSPEQ